MSAPSPPPPGADASAFTAEQRARAYPLGIGDHYWNLSRNRIVAHTLRHLGAASPMLDLGCGPGTTVAYLRGQGFDCFGADLSPYEPTAPELAAAITYGHDATALPAPVRERYRTLLLLDVLEHLPEPAGFLHRCLAAFPHLGHVLVTLPARQELWSNYDAYYGHQRRYDRTAAAALCRDAGAEVLRCTYFFHALYPPLALQRLLARPRPIGFAPVRQRRLHRALATLLYYDARWLPGALPGSSLLLACRPRP